VNFEAASLMLAAIGVLPAAVRTHRQLLTSSFTNGAGAGYRDFQPLAEWCSNLPVGMT
jgi:hypothetical protein